jgi:hypothetical protein
MTNVRLEKPVQMPDGTMRDTVQVRIPDRTERDRPVAGVSVAWANLCRVAGLPLEVVSQLTVADVNAIADAADAVRVRDGIDGVGFGPLNRSERRRLRSIRKA